MHSSLEFTVVLFICVALSLGALTRYCSQWVRLPYTIVVLLAGLLTGAALQNPSIHASVGALRLLESGAHIAPDLIIFVFLPALVFESAFDLDAHAFRNELGGILVFAIPALLVSTALVGGWTMVVSGLGWHWSWLSALVFGALISATDPVAVVAILRETASPKRLGMLIEGESLMNDGTAIVVFGALLTLLTSIGGSLDIAHEVLSFLWVVGGGVGVGLFIAWSVSAMIARTFNDPLIEISLTIVAAYGAMFVAEGLLHVSGVMAVVTAGLYMSGPGQTLISPEVRHFLHRFWTMITHIANTLIFFLVGLIIAAQHHSAQPIDYAIIALVFVGVVVLRFAIIFAFRPIVALVAHPIAVREATVMAWGGLRGAVSLALALMVSQHSALPDALRHQILLVTAGVVFLTIVINGSTIAWLLNYLSLTERTAGETVSVLGAQLSLLSEVQESLEELAKDPDFSMVPFADVEDQLRGKRQNIKDQRALSVSMLATEADSEQLVTWQQACRIERQAYWRAFAKGTLPGECTRILDHQVVLQLDELARGDTKAPSTRIPSSQGFRQKVLRRLNLQHRLARWQFETLALRYDLARAQMLAAQHVIANMDRVHEGAKGWHAEVRRSYQALERQAKETVEELRSSLPEIAHAIELRLASRVGLNLELANYQSYLEAGAIDADVAKAGIEDIETQMKVLARTSRREAIPETADLVRHMPLFSKLEPEALQELAIVTEEMIFAPGELLIEEGHESRCMYVIARGAAHVLKVSRGKQILLDTLGGGEIVGEMALLTGEPRNASVRAVTNLTVGCIAQSDFERIMTSHPSLRDSVWQAFTRHRFDNLIRKDWRFSSLNHDECLAWLASGEVCGELEANTIVDVKFSDGKQAEYLYLVSGSLDCAGAKRHSPALLKVGEHEVYRVDRKAYLVRMGTLESFEVSQLPT